MKISEEALMSFAQKVVNHGKDATWITATGAIIFLKFTDEHAILKQYTHNGVVLVKIPLTGKLDITKLSKEQKTLLTYVSSIDKGIKGRDAKEHLIKNIPAKCHILARRIQPGDIIDLDGSFAVNHKGQLLAKTGDNGDKYKNISEEELKRLSLINLNYIFCLLLE